MTGQVSVVDVRAVSRSGLVILFLPRLGIAASKNYEAQRFDIQMTVERGGDLLVTETVTFDFSTGPFTRIWRVIPSQRTDGIDVLNATMDGNPCPWATGRAISASPARTG